MTKLEEVKSKLPDDMVLLGVTLDGKPIMSKAASPINPASQFLIYDEKVAEVKLLE